MSLSGKIRSALGYLFEGRVVEFFNAVTRFLRLESLVFIGDKRLFSIDSAEECLRRGQTLAERRNEFVVAQENDESRVIPALLDCMQGTTQYPWISSEKRREKLEELFRQGSRPWIARNLDNGEVAGFAWETRETYFLTHGATRIQIELAPDAILLEFAFVNANYRRRGIFSQLIASMHQEGRTVRLWSITDSDNANSFRCMLNYGLRPDGRVLHYCFFGLIFASLRIGNLRKRFFRLTKDVPYKLPGILR